MKIKELIAKVKTKVSNFLKSIKKTAQDVIPVGIEIGNLMNKIANSKEADAFVALTKTGVDDAILAVIKKYLPIVLREMGEWDESVNKSDGELIKDAAIQINSYVKGKNNFMILGIASKINTKISYGEISEAESVTATHESYNNPALLNS